MFVGELEITLRPFAEISDARQLPRSNGQNVREIFPVID
jgi:hypothetical protein